jgi:uncharacterized membrane protein
MSSYMYIYDYMSCSYIFRGYIKYVHVYIYILYIYMYIYQTLWSHPLAYEFVSPEFDIDCTSNIHARSCELHKLISMKGVFCCGFD